MQKRFIAAIAIGLVLLIGIIYLLMSPSRQSREQSERDQASSSEPGMRMDDSGQLIIEDDPATHLERYKKWAQYPPTSRPLFSGQVDLLDPYNATKPPIGVLQSPAQGCEPSTGSEAMKCAKPAVLSDVTCSLTPERYISIGSKDFRIFLSCASPKQNEGKPLPIDSIESKVYRQVYRKITPSLPAISSADDGQNGDQKAGDRIYTFTVRPTAQDWGDMFLETTFKVGGFTHNQRANWFSTPHKIGEFQQGIRDANRNGQLVLSVPVNILKAGYYKFDANLVQQEGDKAPVASATFEGDLQTGNQTIEIVFFGKVIKDSKLDGPYVVRNIRGMRNNSPVTPSILKASLTSGRPLGAQQHTEPLQEYMEPLAGEHVTDRYKAAEFSGEEWQSEEKDRRMKYLEGLVKEGN